jgi:hypothetical protein
MRAVIAGIALCLITAPALAASPKVEAAVKVFRAVGADAAKARTFCAMSKVMEQMGEKEDKAAEAQVDRFMDQLGSDFKTAWEAADGLDENSADGKVYFAALDDLEGKCAR